MSKNKKKFVEDEDAGAPTWLLSYSDCMTLLLTFFVLLLTFSSFDNRIYQQFYNTLCEDLPTLYYKVLRNKDSFLEAKQLLPTSDLEQGSEKPSLERGPGKGLINERLPKDFHNKKVFVGDSELFFYAKGAKLTEKGTQALTLLGVFLTKVPGRIVVSENGQKSSPAGASLSLDNQNRQLGLQRALAVVDFLTSQIHLDINRFSITSSSTIDNAAALIYDSSRLLEVVILEQDIYK